MIETERYHVFAGAMYYASGGWQDHVGSASHREEAEAMAQAAADKIAARPNEASDAWAHVVDMAQGTVVYECGAKWREMRARKKKGILPEKQKEWPAPDRGTLHTLLRLRFGLTTPAEVIEALHIDDRVEFAQRLGQNHAATHTRLHHAVKQVSEGTLDCLTASERIDRSPALWH